MRWAGRRCGRSAAAWRDPDASVEGGIPADRSGQRAAADRAYRLDPVGRRSTGHGAGGRRPGSGPLRHAATSATSGSIASRSRTASSRPSWIGGGYQRREYWREPFVDNDRTLTWAEAMRTLSRPHRPPRPGDVDGGHLSRGTSGLSRRGRELVRGGGLRGVRRKEPADDVSLVSRGRPGALRGHPDRQQLQRHGSGASRQLSRPRHVRHLRHGRERQGMVLDGPTAGGFLLGGAWNEPRYMFADYDARPPFDRSHGNGFRLAPTTLLPRRLSSARSTRTWSAMAGTSSPSMMSSST